MVVANARKSLSLRTQWQSPKDKRPYQIRNVEDDKITIVRIKGGRDSEFGSELLLNRLKKINSNGGRLLRNEFGAGVANMSTIVFLHPALSWSHDFQTIITSEWKGIGIISNHTMSEYPSIPNDEGERQMVARKIRRGQRLFRERLLSAYNKKCCITGCEVQSVLEAVHIFDHAKGGINQPENGLLLLRSDIHVLFDENLIMINPHTHTISVSSILADTEYAIYHGRQIAKRIDGISVSDTYLKMKAARI